MTILPFTPKTSIKLFALFKYPFQRSEGQNIGTPYQFWKIRKDGSAVFLAIQLNIAQQQQLEILTLLCYWRINLLTMKVLFIMLQMNHRNALRRRRRFRPYWVLPRPAKSWLEIHFNRRIIVNWNNETEYIRLPLLAAWRMLMDFVTLNKQKVR